MAGLSHARRTGRTGRAAMRGRILGLAVIAGMAGGLTACGLFRDDPALSGPGTGAMGDDFDGTPGEEPMGQGGNGAPQGGEEPPEDVDIDLGSPVEE